MENRKWDANTLASGMKYSKIGSSKIFYYSLKRLIDIIGALIGLFLLSPIFIVVQIMNYLSDNRGPLIFSQNRVGKNEVAFRIYKFRSMVTNAEERLKSNKKLYEKYVLNNYKLDPAEDPRITKFGRFMRRTSIDEIPQLLNVLKGDMSLVGPRPVIVEELKEYKDKKELFLSVKPGVTGYWQISGRSNVGYPERVDLELFYVNNQKLSLDIKIIFKTIFMVLVGRGAY